MDHKNQSKKQRTEAEIRADRLKASLKANMGKRKAQTRARDAENNKAKKE